MISGVAPANQTKERPVHEFPQGHSGTKVQCESCLFSQGRTPEFTKIGEIHELFVLALFLVWFAGATPDDCCEPSRELQESLGPSGPEILKKSEKSLPGPPAPGPPKVWKKSRKSPQRLKKSWNICSGLFRDFQGPQGRRCRETLFHFFFGGDFRP